jgi:hypothetical protein
MLDISYYFTHQLKYSCLCCLMKYRNSFIPQVLQHRNVQNNEYISHVPSANNEYGITFAPFWAISATSHQLTSIFIRMQHIQFIGLSEMQVVPHYLSQDGYKLPALNYMIQLLFLSNMYTLWCTNSLSYRSSLSFAAASKALKNIFGGWPPLSWYFPLIWTKQSTVSNNGQVSSHWPDKIH